ncbi:MAG: hypothetical protein RIS47_413 [Bacteroidota bacterium]
MYAQTSLVATDSAYQNIVERSFTSQIITHTEMSKAIRRWVPVSRIDTLGFSSEGRPLYKISIGSGPIRILIWSQMHGNEPTGTLALMDLLKWANQSSNSSLRNDIFRKLSIVLVPMLNPDGAQQFNRNNATGIDINRDAKSQQAIESLLLNQLIESFKPQYAISLHDQNIYLGNPDTQRPASISFMAAYPNANRGQNHARLRAISLIAQLKQIAETYVPGGITRYEDAYIETAFDEYLIRNNTASVLIETGGFTNDPQKQYLRRVNFNLLVTALEALANQRIRPTDTKEYDKIPVSQLLGYDLIIRNATYRTSKYEYQIDIGTRHTSQYNTTQNTLSNQYYIATKGDLSNAFGYQEIDATGLLIVPGRLYPKTFDTFSQLSNINSDSLLGAGYTTVKIKEQNPASDSNQNSLNIVNAKVRVNEGIEIAQEPNFLLVRNGKVVSVIVNGIYRTYCPSR